MKSRAKLCVILSSIVAYAQSSVVAQEYTCKCGYKENIDKITGNNSKLSFSKGNDGIYCTGNNQYGVFLHLMQNLPHDIKWKMVIDERNHDKNDCMIFDKDRREGKLKKGEPGYHDSVLKAWEFMSQKLSDSEWDKMDAKKLQQLHDIGIMDVDNKKVGYKGAVCLVLESNSTFTGMLEFLAQTNSGLEFEKELSSYGIIVIPHSDDKCLKGKEDGIYYEFYGSNPFMNVVDNESGKKNSHFYGLRFRFGDRIKNGSDFVDKTFSEYYNTLNKIKTVSNFNLPKANYLIGYQRFMKIVIDRLIGGFWIFAEEEYSNSRSELLKFIGNEYKNVKKGFNSSSNNEKILELIVRVCRALDQAHVFPDGNIRVCRLLMNMLLIKNGMLPALFRDFNTLDFFDVESLVNEIKAGQQKFLDLIHDNSKTIRDMVGIELIS